ncbi:MAG: hypothetical protein IPL79_06280 [Myxococcales bacterium]|nr:hypothetical protein [Myxococcales bacterium]
MIATCCAFAGAQHAAANPAACGAFLPVETGKVWYFEPTLSVITVTPVAGQITPRQPKDIAIKVTDVQTTATGGARVTLEETFDKVVVPTTVTCEKAGIVVDPKSFLFSGEPGGAFGIELADVVRPGVTLQTTGAGARAKFAAEWSDDLKATYRRPAHVKGSDLGSGALELTRRWISEGDEKLIIVDTTYDTTKLALDTTGKVIAKGSEKPFDMRQAISTLWFARGTGLVKVQNSYGHAYQRRLTPPTPATATATPVPPSPPAPPVPPAPPAAANP